MCHHFVLQGLRREGCVLYFRPVRTDSTRTEGGGGRGCCDHSLLGYVPTSSFVWWLEWLAGRHVSWSQSS